MKQAIRDSLDNLLKISQDLSKKLSDPEITKDIDKLTKLNKELLSSISKSSKGIYIDGFNTEQVVESVVERLKEMDKKEFESKQFVAYKDQFQWFIAFAILFRFPKVDIIPDIKDPYLAGYPFIKFMYATSIL